MSNRRRWIVQSVATQLAYVVPGLRDEPAAKIVEILAAHYFQGPYNLKWQKEFEWVVKEFRSGKPGVFMVDAPCRVSCELKAGHMPDEDIADVLDFIAEKFAGDDFRAKYFKGKARLWRNMAQERKADDVE